MPMHSPSHPGQVVRGLIEDSGVTIAEAARRLKVSRQQLTRLIGEQSGLSAEMTLRLEAVFGSSAENWMRVQDAWELAQVRKNAKRITAGLRRLQRA